MGDRCTVTIEVHPEDEKLLRHWFEEDGYGDEPDDEGESDRGAPVLMWFEVDGGGVSILDAAARDGVRFEAHNDEGGGYGASLTVACDGDYECADTDREHRVLVPLDDNGEPLARELEAARVFLKRRAAFRASLPKKEAARG